LNLKVGIRPMDHDDQQDVQIRRAGDLPHPPDPHPVICVRRRHGDDEAREVYMR
jgi:hypothetical protein